MILQLSSLRLDRMLSLLKGVMPQVNCFTTYFQDMQVGQVQCVSTEKVVMSFDIDKVVQGCCDRMKDVSNTLRRNN